MQQKSSHHAFSPKFYEIPIFQLYFQSIPYIIWKELQVFLKEL